MLEFRDRRALVTGASRGLGAHLAQSLAAQGAHVFLGYRSDERGAEAVRERIASAGGSAALERVNLAKPAEIRELFNRISESGGLDYLVHNAAIGNFKPVTNLRANQWDLTLDVNARAFLLCVQEALPLMKGGGRIVAISSLGGARVVPAYGAIGVSKAALESLVRYLAVELAPKGINVNGVAAGLIEDSASLSHHPHHEDLVRRTLDRTPSERLCTPQEIADVVHFLCSKLSNGVRGQMLVVDGGSSLLA